MTPSQRARKAVIDAGLTAEVEVTRQIPELDQALGLLERLDAASGRSVSEFAEPLSKARAIARSGSDADPQTRKTRGGLLRVYQGKIDPLLPVRGARRKVLDAAIEALQQVTLTSQPGVNLDPRHTGKRMRATDPFVEKPGEAKRP